MPTTKSSHTAGSILDSISWVAREIALPYPDALIAAMKRAKAKKNLKNLKKK